MARNAFVYSGNFEQSRYDYLVKELFITGLSEKAEFWRVDISNSQTCPETYDLVDQTYDRLKILNKNQHNPLDTEKTGDHKRKNQMNESIPTISEQVEPSTLQESRNYVCTVENQLISYQTAI
ncbi:hypothetical protein BpHYR1_027690 [Brachionus plicatilis]|uniref:Uncharacterized protein n=1 Tax=Brachionus plicatilis TaxID=10195 RepID=A0A3M7QUX0_BRAPC|nr:hypothetical protein BpHYR1_027690 [Brachionus plicatilis]